MEQLPENNLEQIDTKVAKNSTGFQLRSAREKLGMSVEDIVAIIKLSRSQIIALEADDYKALPELAFIRGFVRSYGKLLQLEVQPLLDGLPGAVKEKVQPVKLEVSFSTDKTLHRKNLLWLFAASIIVLLIGVFVVWQARAVRTTTPIVPEEVKAVPEVPVAPVSAPVAALPVTQPVPVEPAASVPSEKTALRLLFDEKSWVQITDSSGKTLISQVNQPGSELRLNGVAPFSLVIGHAASVHLFYHEQPVDMTPYINAGNDVVRMTLK